MTPTSPVVPLHPRRARRPQVSALALATWAWLAWITGAQAASSPAETLVTRIHTRDEALIQQLAAHHDHLRVDRTKGIVVAELDALTRQSLSARGITLETDHEAQRASALAVQGAKRSIPGYACYRTVSETQARIEALVAQYPELAVRLDIGDSWEKHSGAVSGGEDLIVLRLGRHPATPTTPHAFIMGSIHAREYTPAELVLRLGESLLADYATDPEVRWMLDHQQIHLLVHANPDGRKQAQNGLSWRKNTNTAYCGATSNSRGADLNRNWPFKWAGALNGNGSSASACAETYRGPQAMSEPEVHGVLTYLRQLFADRRGPGDTDAAPLDTAGLFFDLHSYSQLVLWPWGWTNSGSAGWAPNAAQFETLGRRMAWFNNYTPEPITGLYPADGTSVDTVYGELGVASFSFELGTSFFQDCTLFENSILPSNLQALRYALRSAPLPYRWPSGPDVRNLRIEPDLAVPGETLTVRAVADDRGFNNAQGGTQSPHPIQSAVLWSTTAPPYDPIVGGQTMHAEDGGFDAVEESVIGTLQAGAPNPQPQLLYVQATDSSGAAGPPAAAWLDIRAAQDLGTVAGQIRAMSTGEVLTNAQVSSGRWTSRSDSAGQYLRRLPVGTHDLSYVADGYEPAQLTQVAVTAQSTTTADINLYRLCQRLSMDAEQGTQGWTAQSPWAITSAITTQTGSRAWTDSPAGNYSNNANTSLQSPTLDLSGYAHVQLQFDSWCDTEAGWDFGQVELSQDGGSTWSAPVYRCSGDPALRRVQLDLPILQNSAQARIRFRLTSDTGTVRDGWYVDNIQLYAGGPACQATQQPAILLQDGFESP